MARHWCFWAQAKRTSPRPAMRAKKAPPGTNLIHKDEPFHENAHENFASIFQIYTTTLRQSLY